MGDKLVIISDEEDAVQLSPRSRSIICQFCKQSLDHLKVQDRNLHYNNHLETNEQSSRQSPAFTTSQRELLYYSTIKKRKLDVFWHLSVKGHPPDNFTPGLLHVLRKALIKTNAKGTTLRAYLCHESSVHIATQSWDRGWGCGYRNFLMVCTSLISQSSRPEYFALLDHPLPPSVTNLQQWIEAAWQSGYDKEGAAQLDSQLIGTSKWIGTAEVYTAFAHRGIPARLVEFVNVKENPHMLLEWIERYFTSDSSKHDSSPTGSPIKTVKDALHGANPVMMTDRMPLILQHSGHSRTIIGFEKNKNGDTNILVFDPSRRPSSALRNAAIASFLNSTHASKSALLDKPTSLPHKMWNTIKSPNTGLLHLKRRRRSSDISNLSHNHLEDGNQPDRQGKKAIRGGLRELNTDVIVLDSDEDGDNDVVILSSPSKKLKSTQEEGTRDGLDPSKVVSFFRLTPKLLSHKDRYQILYFTLDDPLTEEQKLARRVVTSQRIS